MSFTSCHKQVPGCLSIMEDASKQKRSSEGGLIQETGQEVRPARMVGYSSLDSAKSSMDAGYDDRAYLLWRRGES
ncbi:MAG: hypothetical protein ABIQ95_14980 [Bdellovibrionia bacterium]